MGNVTAVDDIVIVAVAGAYVVYIGSEKLVEFTTSKEAKEYVRKMKNDIGHILDEAKKKGHEIIDEAVEFTERYFSKKQSKKVEKKCQVIILVGQILNILETMKKIIQQEFWIKNMEKGIGKKDLIVNIINY